MEGGANGRWADCGQPFALSAAPIERELADSVLGRQKKLRPTVGQDKLRSRTGNRPEFPVLGRVAERA